jgi:hypothetical protein
MTNYGDSFFRHVLCAYREQTGQNYDLPRAVAPTTPSGSHNRIRGCQLDRCGFPPRSTIGNSRPAPRQPAPRTPDLWDGHVADRVVDLLERHFHAGSSVFERMETAPTAYSGSRTSHAQG